MLIILSHNSLHQENRKTYEITEDGKLKDHFHRTSKGKWLSRHYIQYSLAD